MRSTNDLAVALVLHVSLSTAQLGDLDVFLPIHGSGERVGGEKPWACRCNDQLIGGCHPNCKNCLCTRSFPPKCYCRDITYEDCGDRCRQEQ